MLIDWTLVPCRRPHLPIERRSPRPTSAPPPPPFRHRRRRWIRTSSALSLWTTLRAKSRASTRRSARRGSPPSTSSAGHFRNIGGTFGAHLGHIRGTLDQILGRVRGTSNRGTFGEHSENMHSGNIRGRNMHRIKRARFWWHHSQSVLLWCVSASALCFVLRCYRVAN
jgi:hypothetical protein